MVTRNVINNPHFFVKTIPVFGDLILAPMDGLSDLPFRSLMRNLGSAMSYTEFINARDVINGHPFLERRLSFYEYERPMVFQVFDDDPHRLIAAAHELLPNNPDIIDVNFGCSAKCVTSRGAGAALLRSPQKISQIISTLVKQLDRPVTAKIRLGWDESSLNHLEVARAIEESGASLIAVHGRTKMQGYTGQANWQAIAEIKQALSIPVIANGDVRTVSDIEKIKSLTNCDAVMIGRAALENPWIFSRLDRNQVPLNQVHLFMQDHLAANVEYYGPARGVILFRKYAKRILSPLNLDRDHMTRLMTVADYMQLSEELVLIFEPLPA
jgi:tRNA-dihydrouridine synthase B